MPAPLSDRRRRIVGICGTFRVGSSDEGKLADAAVARAQARQLMGFSMEMAA